MSSDRKESAAADVLTSAVFVHAAVDSVTSNSAGESSGFLKTSDWMSLSWLPLVVMTETAGWVDESDSDGETSWSS